MSIWSDLGRILANLATDALSAVVDGVRTFFEGSSESRRQVAFSIALIALSAKMAKADGVVTRAEVDAFREVFEVPEEEIANVSRLYNLAKQDVAGFDAYGAQVKSLFPGDDPTDNDVLHDVLDALFHIAKADGFLHENELLFLEEVACLFGFDSAAFARIQLRHTNPSGADPYVILGADPSWDFARLKQHYRKRAAECHPDRLIARGVPPEFVTIANDRLAAINVAWEHLQEMHSNRKALPVS